MRTLVAAVLAAAMLVAGCADDTDDRGADDAGPGTSTSDPGITAPGAAPSTTTPRTTEVALERVAEIDEPTSMAFTPDGQTAFVTERAGRVWALTRDGDELTIGDEPALDLTDRVERGSSEQGLLGVAVSPDGSSIVLDFIEQGGTAGTSVVELYPLDGADIDGSRATELVRVDQPFENHNGGSVVFGPDGMLYIGFGDGGSQGDPRGNGQDTSVLLAKILRLDVSSGRAVIPPDNPFADGADDARPEIWLYGVRNPWRFSFDRANGDLWIGDVGGSEREEVDHLPAEAGTNAGKGVNLGWQALEGTAEGDDELAGATPIDPVFEYEHEQGCSITGGFVYRGSKLPGLVGDYVFGDYCAGEIWALDAEGMVRSLGATTDQLSSFAEDPDGELYALSLGGEVLAITAT